MLEDTSKKQQLYLEGLFQEQGQDKYKLFSGRAQDEVQSMKTLCAAKIWTCWEKGHTFYGCCQSNYCFSNVQI